MDTLHIQYDLRDLEKELVFSTSRSSGKGGQHVNTTETRVELRFNIPGSGILTEGQKFLLISRLHSRLTLDGSLRMVSQKERSQSANKEDVLHRFFDLITRSLKPKKIRIPVKPGRAAKESRLQDKKAVSSKKELRRSPERE